jgi:protein-S-isoprenylcysteine O-methyltransferase Ste14
MRILGEEQLEVLKILYPWYKEEVFRRREQMMRLTAFASAFLVLLLVTMLAVRGGSRHDVMEKLFAVTGVILFSGVFGYLILQQRDRHRMAKQALIEIERALGLYEEGLYLLDKPLYPESWQTAWLGDRSVAVYLTVLSALTVLVIAAVLLRT